MNDRKIKAKMVELGITQKDLALELGISIQNLNAKLNGRGVLSITEAAKITKVLSLENPIEIFFASIVPNMQRSNNLTDDKPKCKR